MKTKSTTLTFVNCRPPPPPPHPHLPPSSPFSTCFISRATAAFSSIYDAPSAPIIPPLAGGRQMRSASKALDGQPTIASNSAADVPETAHSHGSAPPVAMKSPVASQSPQYYVKAVSNSANPATWDLYEGFMENGKEHGLGRYTWADSESLLCTWNQGRCREKVRLGWVYGLGFRV